MGKKVFGLRPKIKKDIGQNVNIYILAHKSFPQSPYLSLKYDALGKRTRGRNYNQAGSRRDIGKDACNFFFPIKINNLNPLHKIPESDEYCTPFCNIWQGMCDYIIKR